MSELKTLQAELAAGKQRIKEIDARIASIEGMDRQAEEEYRENEYREKEQYESNLSNLYNYGEDGVCDGFTKF